MDDFKEYDKAVIAFQKNLKINRMPLHSWDIYGASFSELSQNIIDARNLEIFALENKWKSKFDFQSELSIDTTIIITSPKIEIVYSSGNIIKMNGYKPEEVLGKSPKMFQGEKTDTSVSSQISKSILAALPFEHTIINYHKNGTAYDCHIKGFPVFNIKGDLCHFIAFERVA